MIRLSLTNKRQVTQFSTPLPLLFLGDYSQLAKWRCTGLELSCNACKCKCNGHPGNVNYSFSILITKSMQNATMSTFSSLLQCITTSAPLHMHASFTHNASDQFQEPNPKSQVLFQPNSTRPSTSMTTPVMISNTEVHNLGNSSMEGPHIGCLNQSSSFHLSTSISVTDQIFGPQSPYIYTMLDSFMVEPPTLEFANGARASSETMSPIPANYGCRDSHFPHQSTPQGSQENITQYVSYVDLGREERRTVTRLKAKREDRLMLSPLKNTGQASISIQSISFTHCMHTSVIAPQGKRKYFLPQEEEGFMIMTKSHMAEVPIHYLETSSQSESTHTLSKSRHMISLHNLSRKTTGHYFILVQTPTFILQSSSHNLDQMSLLASHQLPVAPATITEGSPGLS